MGKNKSKRVKRTEFQIMRSRMAKLDYQMKREAEENRKISRKIKKQLEEGEGVVVDL